MRAPLTARCDTLQDGQPVAPTGGQGESGTAGESIAATNFR
jgi:hypothetical protein